MKKLDEKAIYCKNLFPRDASSSIESTHSTNINTSLCGRIYLLNGKIIRIQATITGIIAITKLGITKSGTTLYKKLFAVIWKNSQQNTTLSHIFFFAFFFEKFGYCFITLFINFCNLFNKLYNFLSLVDVILFFSNKLLCFSCFFLSFTRIL